MLFKGDSELLLFEFHDQKVVFVDDFQFSFIQFFILLGIMSKNYFIFNILVLVELLCQMNEELNWYGLMYKQR